MVENRNHTNENETTGKEDIGTEASFEENMARLEELVRQLERGELSLENALNCYQEGVNLVGLCQSSLDRAAKEVEILTETLKKDNPST